MMRNKWDPCKCMELISKEIQIDLIFTLCVNLQMHPIQVTVELVCSQFLEIINTKCSQDFSKGGSHWVKQYRHGVFATEYCRLFA